MGKGDNRRSPKMKRRNGRRKLKERIKRRKAESTATRENKKTK